MKEVLWRAQEFTGYGAECYRKNAALEREARMLLYSEAILGQD
jgi:hypothetical protein